MASTADAPQGNWTKNSRGYQTLLVFLLSLNFGIVFFDRQALGALMPFVQPEFQLTGLQIGLLASGLSFSWAIAAFFVGGLSDSLGKRKILLVMATIAFSLCSFLSGLATSFLLLFGARLLMGAAEGGVMPISHAMVASEVDPKHRGLAQGVAQNLGSNLLGSFAAPALLTWVAVTYGWRDAFYFAAAPGLLSAALIWFLLDEPANLQKTEKVKKSFGQVAGEWVDAASLAMKIRNMWISVVVGILMVAHFVITWTFMQTFLIQQRGMEEIPAGLLMSSLGIAAAIYSFVVSGLSDRIGRKPVMVVLPFLSLVGPLGVLLLDPASFSGEGLFGLGAYATVLIPIFFLGWMVNGNFPIFMATIPSETFKPIHHATVLGLAMGFCEVLGGVGGPPLAGLLNDNFGQESFLWLMMGLAVVSGFVAMGLEETAPRVLAKRGAQFAAV